MSNVLTSLPGYIISALTIAGLIVLIALGKATFAEAAPLIAALAGGHLVAATGSSSPPAASTPPMAGNLPSPAPGSSPIAPPAR